MNIKGKIIQVMDEQNGESAKGPWRKKEYILETEGEYPKQVCFMAWNDKIDAFAINEGDVTDVSFNLKSREYNGRWYTDVEAWKVTKGTGMSPLPPGRPDNMVDELDDDIPF